MVEEVQYRVVVNTIERGNGVIDVHPPPPQEVTDQIYARLSGQATAGDGVKGHLQKPTEIMPVDYGQGIRFLILPAIASAKLKWLGQHAVDVLRIETGQLPDISYGNALEAASQNNDTYIKDVQKNPYL